MGTVTMVTIVFLFISVNSLTSVQKSSEGHTITVGPEFRWDYILIYSVLLFFKGSSTGM